MVHPIQLNHGVPLCKPFRLTKPLPPSDRIPKPFRTMDFFSSGQLGLDPATGAMADGIEAQTRLALRNLVAILHAAGVKTDRVLKATIYVANMDDFARVNQLYAEVFTPPFPAREVVQAARLPKNGLVEISAIVAE